MENLVDFGRSKDFVYEWYNVELYSWSELQRFLEMNIIIGSTFMKKITKFVLTGATGAATDWEFVVDDGTVQDEFAITTTDDSASSDGVMEYSASTIGMFFPVGSAVQIRATNGGETTSWFEYAIRQVTSYSLYYALSSDTTTNGEAVEGIPESVVSGNTILTDTVEPTVNRSVVISDYPRYMSYKLKLAASSSAAAEEGVFELSAMAYDGSPPYTYTWSPTTDLTVLAPNRVLAQPDATTSYNISVRDSRNAYVSRTITVLVSVSSTPAQPLVVNAGSDKIVMPSTHQIISDASVTGGVSPYTYAWIPGAKFVDPTVLNADFVSSGPGTFTITLTVTDAVGNISNDTAVITVPSTQA